MQNLIDASRDYDCCRYFDLIKRIEDFYRDGIITLDELNQMQDMRGETLINYQVSLNMLSQTKPSDKNYQKLTELTDYLRRCWQVMTQAYNKGVSVHKGEKLQSRITPQKKDKKLILNVTGENALLLSSVLTTEKRRQIEMKQAEKQLANLSPQEKEKASKRVLRALEQLEQDKINEARYHLMILQREKS